jgi:hypothetical protein
MIHIAQVPDKIRQIYAIVSDLENMLGRHFTPDGHMVGSIGEVRISGDSMLNTVLKYVYCPWNPPGS